MRAFFSCPLFLISCLFLLALTLYSNSLTLAAHGVVAQLGERTVRNGKVVGSTPVNSTNVSS
jgi:hypothetical protein